MLINLQVWLLIHVFPFFLTWGTRGILRSKECILDGMVYIHQKRGSGIELLVLTIMCYEEDDLHSFLESTISSSIGEPQEDIISTCYTCAWTSFIGRRTILLLGDHRATIMKSSIEKALHYHVQATGVDHYHHAVRKGSRILGGRF